MTTVNAVAVAHFDDAVKSDRCLAQIVTIKDIQEAKGLDDLELAFVLGYQCLVKKGEFKKDQLAIYIEIDSVLDPSNPHFASFGGRRIKSKMIRGVLSQGILGPLSWLGEPLNSSQFAVGDKFIEPEVGDDVTEWLNVRKWVSDDEMHLYQGTKTFPPGIPKTDEERVQKCKGVLLDLVDQDVVVTRKEDGTSATFVWSSEVDSSSISWNLKDKKETFLVCGRNFQMDRKEKDGKKYWEMADKYKIEEKMKTLGRNLAIQGEICGPKIGGNKLGLTELDLFVFNIWDIDDHHYLSWDDVVKITDEMKLKRVPEIYKGKFKSEWKDSAGLMELAEAQEYSPGIPGEGIVVKNNYNKERPRHTFKVISNKFLLFNSPPKKDKPKKEKTKQKTEE